MNRIALWRSRKGYTVAQASQLLDCTPEDFLRIEAGTARSNHPGVRALERELNTPYKTLKGQTR